MSAPGSLPPLAIRAFPMHTDISPIAQRLQPLQHIMVHSTVEVSVSYIGPNLRLPQQVCNLDGAVALLIERSCAACPQHASLGYTNHSLATEQL